jgi:hypothetical protein
MHRPIGVIILAVVAGLAGLAQLYRMLTYLGIFSFELNGKELFVQDAQWGAALWALLLAAIWIWVAMGFWNLRAYAVQFGIFISLFTLIWGFFALLFGSSVEAETIPWILAGIIYLYLSYPGVQKAFVDNERSKLTPEQVEAIDNLEKANAAAGAKPAPGFDAPAPAPAPATPPSDSGGASSS